MSTVKAPTRSVNNSRVYRIVDPSTGDVVDVPSVNTVLGLLNKPGLNGWQVNRHIEAARKTAKIVGEFDTPEAFRKYVRAQASSDTAAIDRGNEFHEVIEELLEYPDNEPFDAQDWMVTQAHSIIDTLQIKPLQQEGGDLIEAGIAHVNDSHELVYAGTTDLFCTYTVGDVTRTAVFDWKSKDVGLHKAKPYPDPFISTAAYGLATHLIVDGGELVPMLARPHDVCVVTVSETGWKLWVKPLDELMVCLPLIEAMAAVFQFKAEVEPTIAPRKATATSNNNGEKK